MLSLQGLVVGRRRDLAGDGGHVVNCTKMCPLLRILIAALHCMKLWLIRAIPGMLEAVGVSQRGSAGYHAYFAAISDIVQRL
jgi:hypothetical protein